MKTQKKVSDFRLVYPREVETFKALGFRVIGEQVSEPRQYFVVIDVTPINISAKDLETIIHQLQRRQQTYLYKIQGADTFYRAFAVKDQAPDLKLAFVIKPKNNKN